MKDAELELGDLTIIAGRNNTGKTYVAYTLYGFLKMGMPFLRLGRFLGLLEHQFPGITNKIIKEGRTSISLDQSILDKQRIQAIQKVAHSFSKKVISEVFSSKTSSFDGSSVDMILNKNSTPHIHSIEEETGDGILSIKYDGSKLSIIFDKQNMESDIFDVGSFFIDSLRREIACIYWRFLLRDLFPTPFILSAERFGISLFYRELDFTKNQLVDMLQKLGDDKNRERNSPYLLIDKATSRYAMPIKDNIDYTRSIPDRRGDKSEIQDHKLFDHIKDMMDGYYRASGDEIRFISKSRGKGRSFNIPLHLASSSARGLSDFYFFLQHVAKKGNLLIIDEPESHLDTANQIQLARLLARFVRAGLKVLITTHSDYLIKEFNNLVMLSKSFADRKAVVRKLMYQQDDFLPPDSIRAYVAENNSLTRCKVDALGIDMPVFDKTIDEINRVANELVSRVTDDAE